MGFILFTLLALLLVYECVALRQNQGKTISEYFWHFAYHYPLIPFALGLLCGHFVWQSATCAALLSR